MKQTLLTGTAVAAFASLGFAGPAFAGDAILTGHDNDYHCAVADNAGNACGALTAELNFVRNGSSLPVLVIDQSVGYGTEAYNSLADIGVPEIFVAPGAVTAGMFNHSVYSAFVVASVTSCGGCDLYPGTGTAIAAIPGVSAAIASFFNAGGGILGLAGATDANAYAYLPDSAGVPVPIYASNGFTTTTAGTSNIPGFFAVNGDQTHNTFSNPGTSGVSPAYQVAETYDGGPAVTLFIKSGSISCVGTACSISSVPEPTTLALMGAGLFGLAAARRRRKAAMPD